MAFAYDPKEWEPDYIELYKDVNILLVAAVCLLIAYDSRPGTKNISTVKGIVDLNSTMIRRGEVTKTAVDWLFEDYRKRNGNNNPVIRAYEIYKASGNIE